MNKQLLIRVVLIGVAFVLGLSTGGSASAKTATLTMAPLAEHWNGSSWTQVKVASGGPKLDTLTAVVASSATDVWAFGWSSYGQHWNGQAWQRIALPVPKGAGSPPEFDAAVAVSADDVWAVGDAELDRGQTVYGSHAFADHWNGHSWRLVSIPPSDGYSRLVGMTALSSTDVWAVGVVGVDTATQTGLRTLTVHWNGTAWKRVASPSPATPYTPARSRSASLAAVAGASSTDVWAVGQYYLAAKNGSHSMHPLVLHWNGTGWKAVASPDPSGTSHRSFFFGVAAPSATGVWAVGSASHHGVQHALAERWDGTRWRIVPVHGAPLAGASALAADDVWAVGGQASGDVTHWDGSAWTIQTKLGHDYALDAVAEVSPTDVWAVGVQYVH